MKRIQNTCHYLQIVSPFITGRRYSSNALAPWQDEEVNDNDVENNMTATSPNTLKDDLLTGLFIVNDPSNESHLIPYPNSLLPGQGGPYPQWHTRRSKFNELKGRLEHLCTLLRADCTGNPGVLDIIQSIKHIPFPPGSH